MLCLRPKYLTRVATADAETVCPEGFHLPSSKEFKTLVAYVGGEDVAGQKLKSTTGWPNMPEYDNWNGTDEFGFNAKPVESGNGTGTDENFWTSTHDFANYSTIVFFKFDPHPTSKVDSSAPQSEFGSTIPFCIGEQNTSPTRTCFVNGEPDTRLSIRCLSNILKCGNKYIDYTQQFCQDDVAYDVCYGHQYDGQKYNCVDGVIRDRSTDSVYKPSWMLLNSEKEYGLFLDTRDGQFYKTIDIDGVVWFAENLNYALEGSLCFENNQYYCDIYGRLYTQKQVLDEGDSIPTGYYAQVPNTRLGHVQARRMPRQNACVSAWLSRRVMRLRMTNPKHCLLPTYYKSLRARRQGMQAEHSS